jgi:hypothetical protein
MKVGRSVWLVPIGLTALALAPLPYGYYIFLRFALCVAAAFLAWSEYQRTQAVNGWLVGLIVLAITYNPFLRVHLPSEVWAGVNVATIAFLVMHMLVWFRRQSKKPS